MDELTCESNCRLLFCCIGGYCSLLGLRRRHILKYDGLIVHVVSSQLKFSTNQCEYHRLCLRRGLQWP